MNAPRTKQHEAVEVPLKPQTTTYAVNVTLLVGVAVGLILLVAAGGLTTWRRSSLYIILSLEIAVAAWNVVRLVVALFGSPGVVRVDDEAVSVPTRPVGGHTRRVPIAELRHAYYVRRTPHGSSGPLLIIEARDHAFELPLEWFSTQGDQNRLYGALQARLDRLPQT